MAFRTWLVSLFQPIYPRRGRKIREEENVSSFAHFNLKANKVILMEINLEIFHIR